MIDTIFSILTIGIFILWALFVSLASAMGGSGTDSEKLMIVFWMGILPLVAVTVLTNRMRGNTWRRALMEAICVIVAYLFGLFIFGNLTSYLP